MSTDNNMTVINEEYERAQKDMGNIIMSDDLLEMMGVSSEYLDEQPSADSHELFISSADDPLDIAKISGGIHTITSQTSQDMAISFEVTAVAQEMLQRLHKSMHLDKKVNLTLKGECGSPTP